VWRRPLDGGEPEPLALARNVAEGAWMPDGAPIDGGVCGGSSRNPTGGRRRDGTEVTSRCRSSSNTRPTVFGFPSSRGNRWTRRGKHAAARWWSVRCPGESHGMSRNGQPWPRAHRSERIADWLTATSRHSLGGRCSRCGRREPANAGQFPRPCPFGVAEPIGLKREGGQKRGV
jgi:hypothetical protein